MDTIFMNSKNSKTFNPHKLLLMDYWCSGYHYWTTLFNKV